MSASNLVIVESPAKAKTIEKYLGGDYHVLASFGHIRDLPPKDGSVLPDEDFAMQWQLGDRAGKPIAEIKKALKNAETLWLATDPDREGEAISWHVQEYLNENNLLKGKTIRRVTFNEITKTAVRKAFEEARELDTPLVEAYLAWDLRFLLCSGANSPARNQRGVCSRWRCGRFVNAKPK